jgi:hypothetical protein
MLCIQIDDVRKHFTELDKLKENNWKLIEENKKLKSINNNQINKTNKTVTKPKPTPAVNNNRIEESRKRLLEAKRAALKQQQQQQLQNEQQIIDQENTLNTDDVNIVIFNSNDNSK